MDTIYEFLAAHGIAYDRCDHAAAFTVEDVERLVPLGGARTKNLFLRDKKGSRQALVVVGAEKPVDLRLLAERTGFERPSFGSAERLKKYLGIAPGAVSLLALVNDESCGVEVFIDRELWSADIIQCHPGVNTATLAVSREGLERLLGATKHRYQLVDIPRPA